MLNLSFKYLLDDKEKKVLKKISIPEGAEFLNMVFYLRDIFVITVYIPEN
ncbi:MULTISPECIES: hypothetical protein [Aneurinibacillus]|nr:MULTISPECIES: hypothetical protein [Aneurinibacillus]MED0676742.1 hypothetical protein [Aneurinibacillus thermoaerophilus]MED0735689.1 hypothetical protein [Aneurinibacillus thermoaerophilus]MED0757073.1 hypothetical protein [Aneurinibacillus thermoaerophilus]MED0760432.1 hypothetical protein [Aneurinibacillus thermoaerophilus]